MNVLKKILKKLKNPFILTSTLTNIWILLELLGITSFIEIDKETYLKVIGIIVFILLQIRIIENKQSDEEIIDNYNKLIENKN